MWKTRPYDQNIETDLLKSGQHKLISRLLAQRNINKNDIPAFLSSTYNEMSHPHKLCGIKEAVDIFIDVVKNHNSVGVIGDYDVDGVLSAAMLKELCNTFKISCNIFLPQRSKHGYGLSDKSIEAIKSKFSNPPYLLFIVDCGSNSEKEVCELKKWGVKKIIIIDHHIIEEDSKTLSADVLVNWRINNFQEMCTCGEIFHFIRGIRWLTKHISPNEFITYAAIGTLADLSPIEKDNRIIVKYGLRKYALDCIIASGIHAIKEKCHIYSDNISVEDVVYNLAPKINAAGRIENPYLAYDTIIEHDAIRAEKLAQNLIDINKNRKIIQKNVENLAMDHIKQNINNYPYGIVLFGNNWHGGVLGIVASRLAETFIKPSLVIGNENDVLKGSGRSIQNINLKMILDDCKYCFVNYGGHNQAAGLTVKAEYKKDLNNIFNEACKKYYDKYGHPHNIKYYDAGLRIESVTLETAQMLLDSLYPYCSQGNPEPIFLLSNVVIANVETFGNEFKIMTFFPSKEHKISSLKFKIFNPEMGSEIEGMKVDIYFTFPQSLSGRFEPTANTIEIIQK